MAADMGDALCVVGLLKRKKWRRRRKKTEGALPFNQKSKESLQLTEHLARWRRPRYKKWGNQKANFFFCCLNGTVRERVSRNGVLVHRYKNSTQIHPRDAWTRAALTRLPHPQHRRSEIPCPHHHHDADCTVYTSSAPPLCSSANVTSQFLEFFFWKFLK